MISKLLEKWWVVITLILIFITYIFGVREMYFHQDDLDWMIMANRSIQEMLAIPVADHINYLFRLLLKVEWDLFRWNFAPFLAVSLFLHSLVVWFIYKLALSTSRRRDLAAIAALLFVVNTNWTEVVLWTSGQTISITVLFVLLAMNAIYERKNQIVAIFASVLTSALALGLPVAAALVYGFRYDGKLKDLKLTKVGIGSILSLVFAGFIYVFLTKGGTQVQLSLIYIIQTLAVFVLAIVNTLFGRLIIPFDRFETMRIVLVGIVVAFGIIRWRKNLIQIYRDNWSRFLIIQLCTYYLIVAMGRSQYGIGIMRAERYAYLGLALMLLLVVRVIRNLNIQKIVWIVPVIVVMQVISFYRRAEDYVVRPQQFRVLVEQLRDGSRVEPSAYLPNFIFSEPRLKYSDLLPLIKD